ncbi:ECF transporter S component [Clostridium sp. 'deep sea']|uniref:ECF transporter S component n=1 Tax=Clostridium sp. 'deep sea' TaxID=2779445 RepID=UPI0018968BB9|nr:ECF transporter S component [Clostridium sp. 'deep sea']QOR35988.1 ECF transporter S component [Clostridium sp. 'deep sea']
MVSKTHNKILEMVITSTLIAVVIISTRLGVNFTGSPGGYSHFGNIPLIAVAILLGRRKGAIVGGLGMAIFDLFSEFAAWAPYTFIIRFAMGYTIGYFSWINGKQGKSITLNSIGIFFGAIIMMGGYFLAEYFIYGNWVGPIQAIPGNILQLAVGIFGGVPLAAALRKNKLIRRYLNITE